MIWYIRMQVLFLPFLLQWQQASAASCDACGADARYTEMITTDSGFKKRTATTNGCPNHHSYCTGKSGVSGCGIVGSEGTSSEAETSSTTYEIPAGPVMKTSGNTDQCRVRHGCQSRSPLTAYPSFSVLWTDSATWWTSTTTPRSGPLSISFGPR